MEQQKKLQKITEYELWEQIIEMQGEVFITAKALKYSYHIKGGEIFVDRKEKASQKHRFSPLIERRRSCLV